MRRSHLLRKFKFLSAAEKHAAHQIPRQILMVNKEASGEQLREVGMRESGEEKEARCRSGPTSS